jgi:hypothetical protein
MSENTEILKSFSRSFEEFQDFLNGKKTLPKVRDHLDEWKSWAEEIDF